ncbi:phosphate ABC transporter permease subunit PstC [Candidatus Bathyarchaeota archaeon]|nr:phosphate ABC transporter permease subunit PstC [Candidatus Bathyarchaeota archaeon]
MRIHNLKEFLIEKFLFASSIFSIIVVTLIFILLLSQGILCFRKISILDFLFGQTWQPTSLVKAEFGTVPLVYGTAVVTSIAMAISVPLGVAIAVYIAEIANPIEKEILKPLVELLAGVPSVVYGFFALVTLATWIQQLTGTNSRLNALNGGLILAIMVIPTIVSLAEDAISSVPKECREGSMALGASKWETIKNVTVPSAAPGILAAILLGFGRAVGETMGVLMATGNAAVVNFNILDSVRTMTATIVIETPEVAFGSLHYHALFAVALLLFLITFVFNYMAGVIMRRYRRTGR